MTKILFLTHDLGQGGAEKVLVNLVNHMDRTKFDITVCTLFDGVCIPIGMGVIPVHPKAGGTVRGRVG